MKKFTDSAKWQDPWFRKLSGPAKLLWHYLTDQADPAGVVDIDYDLVTEDCRLKITDAHMAELGNRVQLFNGSKVLITKFIPFQYGRLSDTCHPHKRVFDAISKHGLIETDSGFAHPDGNGAIKSEKSQSPPKEKTEFSIPDDLSAEAKLALADWKRHRKEIRKAITPSSWEKLIEDFQKDQPLMTATVRKSIVSGWQGLFPEKITAEEIKQLSTTTAKPSWLPVNWQSIAVDVIGSEATEYTTPNQIPADRQYEFEMACRERGTK